MASIPSHRKLIYAAYGFYALLSLAWAFLDGYSQNKLIAIGFLAIFSSQAYFMKRVVHLILGIILMLFSIFGALNFISWGGRAGFDTFIYVMTSISVASIFFSGILLFGYLRTSFNND